MVRQTNQYLTTVTRQAVNRSSTATSGGFAQKAEPPSCETETVGRIASIVARAISMAGKADLVWRNTQTDEWRGLD
jgi:hypothetical protein